MNIRCGTDIIEISRIKKSIDELGEAFINKVFTPIEIKYCESKGKQKYQHYAARFSAKEAIYKAISEFLGEKDGLIWTAYEVSNNDSGKPKVTIKNELANKIEDIDISLSHCKEYAIANVTIIVK